MSLELKLIEFGTLWFNFENLNSLIRLNNSTYAWEKLCALAESRGRSISNKQFVL